MSYSCGLTLRDSSHYDERMDQYSPERRRFIRASSDVRTELHQGAASWDVKLKNICLNGLAVTQPDDWDADYSHPFNFVLHLKDGSTFEAHAHLIHVQEDSLGFQMEHLGPEQLGPLAELLAEKCGEDVIEEELRSIGDVNG